MEDASVYNLPIDLLTNLPIKFSSIDTIYRASTFQTKNLKRKARKHNPKFKTFFSRISNYLLRIGFPFCHSDS